MLHTETTGEGPALLLVHGFPLDGAMWDHQVRGLSDVARCVVPDLAGFGRSPARNGLSMDACADDLARVLDGLGEERVDLAGFSMGGYVALAFAERHPKRLRSLVLVDTKAAPDDERGRAGRDSAAQLVREEGVGALAAQLVPKLIAAGASADVRRELEAMIERASADAVVAALVGMRDRPDRTRLLKEIDVPSLVVCGEQDALTPPDVARAMADLLRRSRLVLIPRAGHMSPMEQPSDVTAAIRAHLVER